MAGPYQDKPRSCGKPINFLYVKVAQPTSCNIGPLAELPALDVHWWKSDTSHEWVFAFNSENVSTTGRLPCALWERLPAGATIDHLRHLAQLEFPHPSDEGARLSMFIAFRSLYVAEDESLRPPVRATSPARFGHVPTDRPVDQCTSVAPSGSLRCQLGFGHSRPHESVTNPAGEVMEKWPVWQDARNDARRALLEPPRIELEPREEVEHFRESAVIARRRLADAQSELERMRHSDQALVSARAELADVSSELSLCKAALTEVNAELARYKQVHAEHDARMKEHTDRFADDVVRWREERSLLEGDLAVLQDRLEARERYIDLLKADMENSLIATKKCKCGEWVAINASAASRAPGVRERIIPCQSQVDPDE